MTDPEERAPLPSLVADDLVELARSALAGGLQSPTRLTLPDGGAATWSPVVGRPVALDYAVMELLLEIRDGLRHDHQLRVERSRLPERFLPMPPDGELLLPGLEPVIVEVLLLAGAREERARATAGPLAAAVRKFVAERAVRA